MEKEEKKKKKRVSSGKEAIKWSVREKKAAGLADVGLYSGIKNIDRK